MRLSDRKKAAAKRYSDKNREHLNEYARQYYKKNKGSIAKKAVLYNKKNRKHINKYMREFRKNHSQSTEVKKKTNAYQKKYHQRPKIKERKKKYRQNPEVKESMKRYRPRINAYHIKRRREDIEYRITCRLRTLLWQALKEHKGNKQIHMEEYLGCRVKVFKKYIESQFKPWMNWEKYGTKWHFDHRIPCANFDLTKVEEQKKCFNWANIQPLEATKNMSKGNKYNEPNLLQFDEFKEHKTHTLESFQTKATSVKT